jgi:RHS repeat-associated protein
MKAAMAGLGKAFKKLRKLQKGSKKMKALSDKMHKAAKKAMGKLGVPPSVQNKVHRKLCTVTGHPVDVATGKVFTDAVDFELPGPLPLRWERVWYSCSVYQGGLGHGWHHSYDVALNVSAYDRTVTFRTADGRPVSFPFLAEGSEYFDRASRLTVRHEHRGWSVRDPDQITYRFTERYPDEPQLLIAVENAQGHSIQFVHEGSPQPVAIIDSRGMRLRLMYDNSARLTGVLAPDPGGTSNAIALVRYAYDTSGNLAHAYDSYGYAMSYVYENHLLTRETDRIGQSFYFEYDGHDATARCVRTWGSEGMFARTLRYDESENLTLVTDSLGSVTRYYCDPELGVVIRSVDSEGNVRTWGFNEYAEKLRAADALGNELTFAYDDGGSLRMVTWPDGGTVDMENDVHGNRIQAVDRSGGIWRWEYDEAHRMIGRVNPVGERTGYAYGPRGLRELLLPGGARALFDYNGSGDLARIQTTNGMTRSFEYDLWGRRTACHYSTGAVERWAYDLNGRVVTIEELDGNIRSMEYDAEGNLIRLRDRRQDIRIAYGPGGRPTVREEGGGHVRFAYDSEGRLIGICNAAGRWFRKTRDSIGRVVADVSFNGSETRYRRDPEGRPLQVYRQGALQASYEYDACGRLTAARHHGASRVSVHNYEYRADDALMSATNDTCAIRFERDGIGRVIKEWQDDHWVASKYGPRGQRIQMLSSLGADQTFESDDARRETLIAVGGGGQAKGPGSPPWRVRMQKDVWGLPVAREYSGSAKDAWERDAAGRPVAWHRTQRAGTIQSTKYEWDNARLVGMVDSQAGATTYQYDGRGLPCLAVTSEGAHDWNCFDLTDNLFATPELDDRIYGASGELLEQRNGGISTRYEYDESGRLTSKRSPSSGNWTYGWDPEGTLRQVQRPDGRTMNYSYDALGRRVRATTEDKRTQWLWDGNVPLHERRSGPTSGDSGQTREMAHATTDRRSAQAKIVTWLFEPDSMAPMAKIEGQEFFAILTDFTGATTAMYSSRGDEVWSGKRRLNGGFEIMRGNRTDCPFRNVGQMEDDETGLYYNRFRYFDPEPGVYISADPIRYNGGLNLYKYVNDSFRFADPLGLSQTGCGGTLTDAERQALQQVANKHKTTLHVYGSRARGEGRNIDTDLPVGKGPGTKSDIDVRFDGDLDIATSGGLSDDLANIKDGHGNKLTDGRPLMGPPPDPSFPIEPE